jgi:hypothetical protein
MQLVEIKPLKPFCGSYRCALSEADVIDDLLVEKEGGVIVKERVPRKSFVGLISVERAITPDEHKAWKDGKLPEKFEVADNGRSITEHPPHRTVQVPADVASSLISRGLAERVAVGKKAATAAA